jgi:hypothetical protein
MPPGWTELRGHGRATLVYPHDLRKVPVAPREARVAMGGAAATGHRPSGSDLAWIRLRRATRDSDNARFPGCHRAAEHVWLSLATQALARRNAPAVRSIRVVTNLNEPGVDNVVTGKVVALWRAHGPADVRTYQFPADLKLGHDLTDLQQPDRKAAAVISAVVYAKLCELIDR